MDKHSFEVEQERLQGQIRVEKIRGMQQDVEISKSDADIKRYDVAKARTKVTIASVDAVTETFKLSQARAAQRMENLKLTGQEIDINHEFRKSQVKQKVLDAQFQGLETDLSTAKKMLEQRRQLLRQQGVLDV